MTHRTYLILIRPATGPAYHARCTCDGQPTAALVGQALLGDAAGSVLVRAAGPDTGRVVSAKPEWQELPTRRRLVTPPAFIDADFSGLERRLFGVFA